MHDLDRALMEMEMEHGADHSGVEGEEGSDEIFEFGDEGEGEAERFDDGGEGEYGESSGSGFEGFLDDSEELEMAADLLTVSDEAELEQFLGGLFKKVKSKAGKIFKSPVGKVLGNVLKQVAKKALPMAGGAVGTLIPIPGLGTAAGAAMGSAAGKVFGLELEGLSPEDQEMEAAKRFVRLATAAAHNAANAEGGSPADVVKQALVTAAQQHAPGLLRGATNGGVGAGSAGVSGKSGRWIRRGNTIVLLNA